MRYAIMDGITVSNIALADEPLAENWRLIPEGVTAWIGGTWASELPLPPPPEAPEVPAEVTMRQARLALLHFGLYDAVGPAIAAIADEVERKKAQIEWEYSGTVQRHRGLVMSLAGVLGLTSEQLDALFIFAAAIP